MLIILYIRYANSECVRGKKRAFCKKTKSTFRHFDTFVYPLKPDLFLFTLINTKFEDKSLELDDIMSTFAVSKVR